MGQEDCWLIWCLGVVRLSSSLLILGQMLSLGLVPSCPNRLVSILTCRHPLPASVAIGFRACLGCPFLFSTSSHYPVFPLQFPISIQATSSLLSVFSYSFTLDITAFCFSKIPAPEVSHQGQTDLQVGFKRIGNPLGMISTKENSNAFETQISGCKPDTNSQMWAPNCPQKKTH